MRRPRQVGFTLPELLIVIAIIGVLAALIALSVTHAFRLSDDTRCMANLHYLGQALAMRRSDSLESRRPEMKVTHWPIQLLPYVDYNPAVLVCPAGGSSEEVVHRGVDIAELVELQVVTGGGATYYIPFEAGPMCVKLTDAQWEKARAMGLLGNSNYANNLRSKFDCTYQGGPDDTSWWLCFEDYGGDWDFKDVMVRVTDNRDGTFTLKIVKGFTGHSNSIVTKGDREVLYGPLPHGNLGLDGSGGVQLTVGEVQEEESEEVVGGYEASNPYEATRTETEEGGAFVTSYGMNANRLYLTNKSGKIALLDYCKYLARSTDEWGARAVDPNQDGVPIFARHSQRINVLFTDGAVKSVHPDEINPASPTNEILYWEP